ncbi:MAG: hypothetical protein K2P90_03630 [Holosporales bacterium]|nr:hypothetical protein [Holosporales bacterium]
MKIFFRHHLGETIYRFPFVINFLPENFGQQILFLSLEKSFNESDFKSFDKIKDFSKSYENLVRVYLQCFVLEDGNDKDLIENGIKLSSLLNSEIPGTVPIHVAPNTLSKKTIILHAVTYFSIESNLLALLNHFFSYCDHKNFSHVAFIACPLSKEAKIFFQKHPIDIIQKSTLGTPIECDIVLDWDGFATPHNFKFWEGRRPFVISFLNEFLPHGRNDFMLSFESTAELSHLDRGEEIRKQLLIVPDETIFDIMEDPLPLPYEKLPFLENGFITFGSFAHNFKMTDMTFKVWGEILRSIPKSRLELCNDSYGNSFDKERILKKFLEQKITPDRITFDTLHGYPQYCAKFPSYDIILGALPYAGGRTSFHLTENGFFQLGIMRQNFVNTRLFKSIFLSTKTPELILETPQDYIQMAQSLAANPDKIIELRTRIRQAVIDYHKNRRGELTRLVEHFIQKLVCS